MKTWPECESCRMNKNCVNQTTENPCSNVAFELKEEYIVGEIDVCRIKNGDYVVFSNGQSSFVRHTAVHEKLQGYELTFCDPIWVFEFDSGINTARTTSVFKNDGTFAMNYDNPKNEPFNNIVEVRRDGQVIQKAKIKKSTPKSENLRRKFLDEVSRIVCEGAKHYNVAENSYSDIAKMWSVYLKQEITSVDVCMLMALLKVVRTRNNPNRTDSLVDLAGYAAGAFEEINS